MNFEKIYEQAKLEEVKAYKRAEAEYDERAEELRKMISKELGIELEEQFIHELWCCTDLDRKYARDIDKSEYWFSFHYCLEELATMEMSNK